ncbi:MAG: ribosome small subunit-dependent GTPase A [Treponema sp.]|nr:ribosome small subunit-dependent GTPase A [Treponema sp.]
MRGLVLRGSRNLFIVRPIDPSSGLPIESGELQCRIKGKVLKNSGDFYNPIAPGDIVEIEGEHIIALEKRRNLFARFNQKGQAPQILASNVDLVLCVTSPASPPFRPRFVDRVLVQAEAAGIDAAIICNKYDLARSTIQGAGDPHLNLLDIEERFSDFQRIGVPVLRISALTGDGIDDFKRLIAGKFSVLVGQSGAGKSSIIKALIPDIEIKTGAINKKFDRGNHTTTQAILLDVPELFATRIIDTPGIRRFAPAGISPEDVILYMREFAPLAGKCSFGLSCSHRTEPGCKVMEAVHAGVIHEERYESFLRIYDDVLNGGCD